MALTLTGTINLTKAAVPVTGPPYTLACWANCTSFSNFPTAISVQQSGITSNQLWLGFLTGGQVQGVCRSGGSGPAPQTTATASTNTWVHMCASMDVSTQSVYLNGANKITNSGTATAPVTLNLSYLGASDNGGIGSQNATLAFAGMWSAALTDPEVAALAAGIPPRKIRPQSLVSYTRLIGLSPEPDLCSSTAWTVTGSPAVVAMPLQYGTGI